MDAGKCILGFIMVAGLVMMGCSALQPGKPLPRDADAAATEVRSSLVTTTDELGDDVARHVQSRYDESRTDCGSKTSPAFVCSGLLLRSTIYDDNYHSWMPNPQADAGGVVFSWLRQDTNFLTSGPSSNGFIIYPRSVSDAKGMTPLSVRCGFPLEAGSGGDDRCHFKWAPCHLMKPPVHTAFDWLAIFQEGPSPAPDDQCAFAVERGLPDTALAWMQIVGVRQALQAKRRNEIIVQSWRGTDEALMPVEAFFYRTSGNGDPGPSLDAARKDQRKFRDVSGRWIPVIRWLASDSVVGGARFSYDVADQAVLPGEGGGASVARYLQSRYDSSMASCPGAGATPSYACSGLLIRSTMYSDLYFSWRPNPATADWGVSFSWLRKDSNFADSYPTGNGFVVYPLLDAQRRGLAIFDVRCAFPRDAWSAGPDRCLWHQNGNGSRTMTKLCHLHDPAILTAADWKKAGYDDDENQCAFAVNEGYAGRADAWRQMIEVRKLDSVRWRNEIIVKAWTGLDDTSMPIEAFFYRPESRPDKPDPLAGAREDQRDFYKLTMRWVPVIRWDPTDSTQGGAKFSYRAVDQLIPPQTSSGRSVPAGSIH